MKKEKLYTIVFAKGREKEGAHSRAFKKIDDNKYKIVDYRKAGHTYSREYLEGFYLTEQDIKNIKAQNNHVMSEVIDWCKEEVK